MNPSIAAQERTLRLAHDFLEEARLDVERAAADRSDLLPRLRMVHERKGQASPELRTLVIPIPPGGEGASPTLLSGQIARFTASKQPHCLLLTLEVLLSEDDEGARPMLIAEARDRVGTRLFLAQPYEVEDGRVRWLEPIEGGWRDPKEDEMILDAAFRR